MEDIIDFTNCQIEPTMIYGGANGNKIGIIYNNENYMLKFPPKNKKEGKSYTNNPFSEYISCEIIRSMNIIDVQEVILGKYTRNGKTYDVCACKDFTREKTIPNRYVFKDFASLKNTIINSDQNGYGVELESVIETFKEQKLFEEQEITSYFWKLFIIDAFLGNFDRHNGNWGFLINDTTKEVKFSPVFNCSYCLYPQLTDEQIVEIIDNEDEINKRIYIFPNSALRINDVKINYYNFLKETTDENCLKALQEIYPLIDFKKINAIIEKTPGISDIRKKFYKKMLKKRYDVIIDSVCKKEKII